MARYDAVLNDLKDLEQQPNTFKAKLPAPMVPKPLAGFIVRKVPILVQPFI